MTHRWLCLVFSVLKKNRQKQILKTVYTINGENRSSTTFHFLDLTHRNLGDLPASMTNLHYKLCLPQLQYILHTTDQERSHKRKRHCLCFCHSISPLLGMTRGQWFLSFPGPSFSELLKGYKIFSLIITRVTMLLPSLEYRPRM